MAENSFDLKDTFGRTLRVGDICAYPVRRGSAMRMNRFIIQKIQRGMGDKVILSGTRGDGYTVNITNIKNVVLIGRDKVIPFLGS